MRTFRQYRYLLAVVGIAAAVILSPGLATAAYDQGNEGQGSSVQSNPSYNSQDQGNQVRNMRLEQQIAGQLRQQGYGTQGEIMILATGNRVILLGTVPDGRTKNGAEKIAKQVSSGARIDNRLHVNATAKRLPDAELEKDTYDKLGDNLSQDVRVRAQNGTVTLQGNLGNWRQVADAIDAAFAAGATQVNSQFSVAGAGAMAQGGAGGYYPSYGYAPGQQGQAYPPSGAPGFQGQAPAGAMGGPTQATMGDLQLARQVASQLRQQLPGGQNVQLVQPQSIFVTVQNGTVMLHGYVQNNSQKQQAQQIAQSIQGVQSVRNDLAILSTRGAAGQSYGYGGTTSQGYGAPSNQGYGTSSGQGYGAPSSQSYGGSTNQSGSYQPQGYVSPAPYGQPQQGTSSQQGFSGTTNQGQYGQSSQMGGAPSQYGQGGMAGGQRAGMSSSDLALAHQVVQHLKQRLTGIQNIQVMRPGTIYVMAAQGNVTLHGFITNPSVKQQANQIANAVPGVRNVTDTLHVIGGAAGGYPSYGYIPGQGQTNQGTSSQGQGMAGQSQGTSSQNQGMQRFIAESGQMAAGQSDMALAQQVAQRLRQQLSGIQNVQIARPGTIYVIVSKGTVTLDGFVPDSSSKQRAEQIAKSISGVTSVKNSLNIGGAGAGGSALGYLPPEQDQGANAQFPNQPYNQQFGNQAQNQYGTQQPGDQSFGYIPGEEGQSMNQPGDQYGNQMGNQTPGNQASGNQGFEGQAPDEEQAGGEQPDEGRY